MFMVLLLLTLGFLAPSTQLPGNIIELQRLYALTPKNRALKSGLGNALLNYGNELYSNNKQEEALAIFLNLSTLFPNSPAVWHNIGYVYAELNQPYNALTAYQEAINLDPHNPETHICLATTLLSIGDYQHGFAEYEWRWHHKPDALTQLPITLWHNEELSGKKILLRSEGSLGDVIQFIRYARVLKDRGAYVILHTHKALHQLISSCCNYIDKIIDNFSDISSIDFQHSLMSLPYVLDPTQIAIPNEPYLRADPKLIATWSERLQHDSRFKIGLCWQADPCNDANRPYSAQRSIPLSLYRNLTTIHSTSWYSLQAIDGLDQCTYLPELQSWDYDFDQTHGRFMDTAALIMHMDLIITVDTSIAHLAGALGRPVWLLLPYRCDWRWMYTGNHSTWYPTIRIFRKKNSNDWHDVIKEVYEALMQRIN